MRKTQLRQIFYEIGQFKQIQGRCEKKIKKAKNICNIFMSFLKAKFFPEIKKYYELNCLM
jgi:ribonuclease PH